MAIAAANEIRYCLYLERSMLMRLLKNCTAARIETIAKGTKFGMLYLTQKQFINVLSLELCQVERFLKSGFVKANNYFLAYFSDWNAHLT